MRFRLRQLGLNRPFKSRSSWKHANVTQNLQYIKMKKKSHYFALYIKESFIILKSHF